VVTVTALAGSRVELGLNGVKLFIDYNQSSGRVVKVISAYPNHQTMKGKEIIAVLTDLIEVGWIEIGRREWNELFM